MPPSRFRALLATLRIANMPSVVCNVWLGIALGLLGNRLEDFSFHSSPIIALALAGLLLYAAGNLLNDWKDRSWDQTSRPERALPRGLFLPSTYLAAAIICLASGIGLASTASAASGITAAFIAINIVIYTHWHKRHAWTVIPMGLCRALLPVMGFLAFDTLWVRKFTPASFRLLDDLGVPFHLPDFLSNILPALLWILPHSLAILLYIIGLSLSARAESRPEVSRGTAWIARILLASAVLSMALCWMPNSPGTTVIALIPCIVWLIFAFTCLRKPVSKHVSALLAGIPLLDGIALFSLGLVLIPYFGTEIHLLNHMCFLVPSFAFLSGILLQRVAPAT